jgi:hypothetical protein
MPRNSFSETYGDVASLATVAVIVLLWTARYPPVVALFLPSVRTLKQLARGQQDFSATCP